jgi:hypothetical protein
VAPVENRRELNAWIRARQRWTATGEGSRFAAVGGANDRAGVRWGGCAEIVGTKEPLDQSCWAAVRA